MNSAVAVPSTIEVPVLRNGRKTDLRMPHMIHLDSHPVKDPLHSKRYCTNKLLSLSGIFRRLDTVPLQLVCPRTTEQSVLTTSCLITLRVWLLVMRGLCRAFDDSMVFLAVYEVRHMTGWFAPFKTQSLLLLHLAISNTKQCFPVNSNTS